MDDKDRHFLEWWITFKYITVCSEQRTCLKAFPSHLECIFNELLSKMKGKNTMQVGLWYLWWIYSHNICGYWKPWITKWRWPELCSGCFWKAFWNLQRLCMFALCASERPFMGKKMLLPIPQFPKLEVTLLFLLRHSVALGSTALVTLRGLKRFSWAKTLFTTGPGDLNWDSSGAIKSVDKNCCICNHLFFKTSIENKPLQLRTQTYPTFWCSHNAALR